MTENLMLGKRRPTGAHISGPTPLWLSLLPCLGIYAVSTDERFRNQSSWGSFVVVSGSTMPGWKLLDYVFRTSPEMHLDDPLAPCFGEPGARHTRATPEHWKFGDYDCHETVIIMPLWRHPHTVPSRL